MNAETIAAALAKRIGCGCQQPNPCYTCTRILRQYQAYK